MSVDSVKKGMLILENANQWQIESVLQVISDRLETFEYQNEQKANALILYFKDK